MGHHAGIYLVVPLSLIGTHFVGLPAVGAFVSVAVAAAAPFVSVVEVWSSVAEPCFRPPVNVASAEVSVKCAEDASVDSL
jgi:hypothetical protein